MRAPAVLILMVVAALDLACTQEQVMVKASARLIGCSPEDVALENIHREGTRPRAWTATCRSQVWACTSGSGRLTCRLGTRVCRNAWGQTLCEDAPSSAAAPPQGS